MSYYKLRADITKVTASQLKTLVSKYSNVYMYSIEDPDGDNPHTHWYINLHKGAAILRKGIRDLGLSGNSSYSLKELDEEYPLEYISYIMKDGKYFNFGVPQAVLEDAIKRNTEVKAQIKQKKEQKKTIIQKLHEEYVKENPDYAKFETDNTDVYLKFQSKMRIFVMKYHIENELLIRKFSIDSYVDTLMSRVCPRSFVCYYAYGGLKNISDIPKINLKK